MKISTLILSTFLFGFVTSSFAQAQEYSNATALKIENRGSSEERLIRRIIPQVSVLVSDYRGSNAPYFYNKAGYSVGALTDLGSGYNLVGETGVLFRQLNASSSGSFGNTQYQNNYISVPVSAKYYFSGQENTSLYVKAGLMGSTLTAQSANSSGNYSGSVYNVNDRDFELSALAGVGAKVFLTQETDLIVEGSYARDTNSIFSTGSGIYNAAFNFAAGVSLNL